MRSGTTGCTLLVHKATVTCLDHRLAFLEVTKFADSNEQADHRETTNCQTPPFIQRLTNMTIPGNRYSPRAGQGGGGKEAVASVGGGVTHVLCGFWAGNVTGMQWSGSGAWCGRLLVVCHCVPGAVCGTGACAGQDVSLIYWICSCLWLYAECVWRRSGGPSCAMYEYLWTERPAGRTRYFIDTVNKQIWSLPE